MAVSPDQALEEEARSGNHTPIARQGAKRREVSEEPANSCTEGEERFTALRSPFYKPRVNCWVMTGKRRAVVRILLLYWATVVLDMPC